MPLETEVAGPSRTLKAAPVPGCVRWAVLVARATGVSKQELAVDPPWYFQKCGEDHGRGQRLS